MATPHSTCLRRFKFSTSPSVVLLIWWLTMEVAAAAKSTERTVTCHDLACANNNVCYTSIENGTQEGHAYCQCQGEWAGLRCQSKLYVVPSDISAHSVTVEIRGRKTSKPRQPVPIADLFITDLSVSFWNLNGSDGCSIMRRNPLVSARITIEGITNNQSYMICVANGAVDLCRLRSSNSSTVSRKSNCIAVTTKHRQPTENVNIRIITLVVGVVIFVIIVVLILCIKRRSLFVQFLLNVCCCRKWYCCKRRIIRHKRQLVRKHRNVSGNFLLPPDLPFDDSTSFAPSFASTSLSSTAIGNRSSIISDSFRSGHTPDSDDRFPVFLDETSNPLYNPNLESSTDFSPLPFHDVEDQTLSQADFVPSASIGYKSASSSDFRSQSNLDVNVVSNFDLSPLSREENPSPENENHNTSQRIDLLHNTFRSSSSDIVGPHFKHLSSNSGHNTPYNLHSPINDYWEGNYLLSRHNHTHHNTLPRRHSSNESPNSHDIFSLPPFGVQTQPHSIPNGKIRRQFSCPEGKSPIRVFPHGDDWVKQIHDFTPTERRLRTLDSVRRSESRIRPIRRQRPLSYNLDYHYRCPVFSHCAEDSTRELEANPLSSHSAFAVATLPRSRQKRFRNGFPAAMTEAHAASTPVYASNTLPSPRRSVCSPPFRSDSLPNGTIKDECQSTHSYPESSASKDSWHQPPVIKKKVKNFISQFERTLPFLRQNSMKTSATFGDEEFFRDLASPIAVEKRRNSKKKSRPMSYPHLSKSHNTSLAHDSSNVISGVDSIFQGHPSHHVILPFTTHEEEAEEDVAVQNEENALVEEKNIEQESNTALTSEQKKGSDSYVISTFDDDSTNLVTPFILHRSSSEESVEDADEMTSALATECHQ